MTTIAGTGAPGYADGVGTAAAFNQPAGLFLSTDKSMCAPCPPLPARALHVFSPHPPSPVSPSCPSPHHHPPPPRQPLSSGPPPVPQPPRNLPLPTVPCTLMALMTGDGQISRSPGMHPQWSLTRSPGMHPQWSLTRSPDKHPFSARLSVSPRSLYITELANDCVRMLDH